MKKIINYCLFLIVSYLMISFSLSAAPEIVKQNNQDAGNFFRSEKERLKFFKNCVKTENDTALIEYVNQNIDGDYSIEEINIIVNLLKKKQMLEKAISFIDSRIVNKKITDEVRQIYEEMKTEIGIIKFSKMRDFFYKAESYFNAGDYIGAETLYIQALEIIDMPSVRESILSKKRLEEIKQKNIDKKIAILKKTFFSENSTLSEKIETVKIFYKLFYLSSLIKDRQFFENEVIKIFESIEIEKIKNTYSELNINANNELKKKMLGIVCGRMLDGGDDKNFQFYFNEWSAISGVNDTDVIALKKKYTEIHSKRQYFFIIKLISGIIILSCIAIVIIFRKKLIYRYLTLKLKYLETTGERFQVYELYGRLLELSYNDEFAVKQLKLAFDIKKDDQTIFRLFKVIENKSKIDYSMLLSILKLLQKNGDYAQLFEILAVVKSIHRTGEHYLELLKFEFTTHLSNGNKLNAINTAAEIFKIKFESQIIREYINLLCQQNDFNQVFKYLKNWLNVQQNAIRKIAEFTEGVIKKYPDEIKLYDFIGVVYRKLGETEKAIGIYEYLEEKHNMKLPVYSALYDLYMKKNDVRNAIRALNKIVVMREDNSEDKYNLAMLYYEVKEYEQSVRLLTELLIKDANHIRAIDMLRLIGSLYLKDRNFDNAAKIFEFVTSTTNLDVTDMRLELGNIYISCGRADDAISTLQKITTGDRELILKSQVYISQALIIKNDFMLAVEILKQIDDNEQFINSDARKMITYNKGICYDSMGDFETAKKYYQAVIMQDINFKDANERYKKLLGKN